MPSVLAVCVGASLGAILRWKISVALNALFPEIPPGTWLANMLGGYLIGVAIAFFSQQSAMDAEWRLLVITGFLGGLTTFSTFSAEVVTLLQEGHFMWAGIATLAHVIGSLGMTWLGMVSVGFFGAD